MPEVIQRELINKQHDNVLVSHFGNKTIQEWLAKKYNWRTPWANIETYIKDFKVKLVSKTIFYKLYSDLYYLPLYIYCLKDLFIHFVIRLIVFTNWKSKSYDSILVIINSLVKMLYYKPIKIKINILGLIKVNIHVIIRYYNLFDSIFSNLVLVFISKFKSLLCHLLDITQ